MADQQQGGQDKGRNDASKQGTQQADSGGRSEQHAQQRDKEQSQAGSDGNAKVSRDVPNVKSEPHWDPTEGPGARDAKSRQSE